MTFTVVRLWGFSVEVSDRPVPQPGGGLGVFARQTQGSIAGRLDFLVEVTSSAGLPWQGKVVVVFFETNHIT